MYVHKLPLRVFGGAMTIRAGRLSAMQFVCRILRNYIVRSTFNRGLYVPLYNITPPI